jgi:hypothetical protein
VTSEDEVYDACLRWLNHAPEQRKTDFHKVSYHHTINIIDRGKILDT